MAHEYQFVKLLHDNPDAAAEAAGVLKLLDERCRAGGLQPVADESKSHFTFLLIHSGSRWLHFDSRGHYLPMDSTDYAPVVHELSHHFPVMTVNARGAYSYALRRYRDGKVLAHYANLMDDRPFPNRTSAEQWNPNYDDWADLLAPGTDRSEFYQRLPAPPHPETPPAPFQYDHYELLDHLALLFGWNGRLNLSSVAMIEDGEATRGDDFRSASGDYSDAAHGLTIHVRCYAHPNPGSNYSLTAPNGEA